LAPAGTPTEIVEHIRVAVSHILSDPASFAALLSREVSIWRAIVAKQKLPLK
jgi:hypothetical protein